MVPYEAQLSSQEASKERKGPAKHLGASRQFVEGLHISQVCDGQVELLVSYKGWDDVDDLMLEPLANLKEDIAAMVKNFLHISKNEIWELWLWTYVTDET